MKIRHSAIVATVIISALGMSACSSPAEEPTAAPSSGVSDMDPVVLTYSDSNVESAAHALAMQSFMEKITERTDGKVTFESYWSGTLHPAAESLSAIESGLTDITFMTTTSVPDQLPIASWQALMTQGAIPSEYPTSLVAGTAVQIADYETGAIAEELATHEATPLLAWNTAPYPILCKPEVTDVSDLAGLTARTPGINWTYELEALGMTTASIPLSDVYEGIQRGIVQCHLGTASTVITLGMWDEAKYFIPAGFSTAAGSVILMNSETLTSLPEEVQEIIFDERLNLIVDIAQRTVARDIEFAESSQEHDIVWVDPETFIDPLNDARETYVARALADAPTTLPNADEEYERLQDLYERWTEASSDFDPIGDATPGPGSIELYEAAADIDWDAYRAALRTYFDEVGVR